MSSPSGRRTGDWSRNRGQEIWPAAVISSSVGPCSGARYASRLRHPAGQGLAVEPSSRLDLELFCSLVPTTRLFCSNATATADGHPAIGLRSMVLVELGAQFRYVRWSHQVSLDHVVHRKHGRLNPLFPHVMRSHALCLLVQNGESRHPRRPRTPRSGARLAHSPRSGCLIPLATYR
jgi:hypothetical protein